MVFNVQAAFAVKSGDCAAKSNAAMAELADAQDLESCAYAKIYKYRINIQIVCPSGGIGRRAGLRILWTNIRIGSSPISGTKS